MNQKFFAQLIVRLGKTNPKFFKIIQFIAIGLGAVSAGIGYIDTTGAALPSWFSWLGNHEVWISSLVAAILAQLPNKDVNDSKK